jgi:hypothetical protein
MAICKAFISESFRLNSIQYCDGSHRTRYHTRRPVRALRFMSALLCLLLLMMGVGPAWCASPAGAAHRCCEPETGQRSPGAMRMERSGCNDARVELSARRRDSLRENSSACKCQMAPAQVILTFPSRTVLRPNLQPVFIGRVLPNSAFWCGMRQEAASDTRYTRAGPSGGVPGVRQLRI